MYSPFLFLCSQSLKDIKTLYDLYLQFDAWIYADDSIFVHVDKQHSNNSHDGADC